MDRKVLILSAIIAALILIVPGTIARAGGLPDGGGIGILSGEDAPNADLIPTPSPTPTPTATPTPTEFPHPERWEWTPPPPPPLSKGVFEIGFALIGIILIGLLVLGYYILRRRYNPCR